MPTAIAPTALPTAPARRWRRWILMLLLAAAIPVLWQLTPEYEAAGTMIAPLAPALALALAATSRIGWRALPAVVVGAVVAAFGWPLAEPTASQWLDTVVLLAQTAFGGLLMRRSSRPDELALDSTAAIRRLIGVALACGVLGAIAELAAYGLLSTVSITRPGIVALVRATADAASVMLLMPVILAFAAPQRARWLARRRSVALPLGVSTALLLAALAGISDRDRQQALAGFERDADVVFARTQALLDAPVQAVLAIDGALRSLPAPPSPAQFDTLAKPWMARTAGVSDMGWLEAPRTEGGSVVVRHLLSAAPGATGAPAAEAETVAAAQALRGTLNKALTQEGAIVSPVVALGGSEGRTGIVIFQALPVDAGTGARGVVFATVLVDRLLTPLLAARSDALRACLFDTDSRIERRRLFGSNACESTMPAENTFSREAAFDFAGRRWAMRISQPVRTHGGVWLFALPALAGALLLSALLLTVTGRVQRMEAEARARNDDMQRDLDRLRQLQQRDMHTLEGVMETVQIGIALLEPDGRIQRTNTAFAELLGKPQADLRRRHIDDVLQDDDQPQRGRILALLGEAGEELVHCSLRLRLPDGRVVPALLTLRVLRAGDGRVASAVCAVHDLSESLRRRQAERVLGDVLDLARSEPVAAAPAVRSAITLRVLSIHGDDTGRPGFLDMAFQDRPGIELRYAESGSQGLQLASTESPDLVLLDLHLPDGDGLAVLRQLSSDPRTRSLPVIVLSDDPNPDRIDAAFGAGARGYLTKPLDMRQLLAAIDDVI